MMPARAQALAAVTVIACSACALFAPGEDYSGVVNFEVRDGNYLEPPPAPPRIALLLSTTTQYPCMNYRLPSDLSIRGTVLRVDVSTEVVAPAICLTAVGPAGDRIALPVSNGTYTLEFKRAGLTDRYRVTVTDAAIDIAVIASQFTHPLERRVPRTN